MAVPTERVRLLDPLRVEIYVAAQPHLLRMNRFGAFDQLRAAYAEQ